MKVLEGSDYILWNIWDCSFSTSSCAFWILRSQMHSRVWLFVTPRTVAHQAPLSMEFSREQYWSGLQFPPPGNLTDSRIETASPAQADSLPLSHLGSLSEHGGLVKKKLDLDVIIVLIQLLNIKLLSILDFSVFFKLYLIFE